MPFHVNADLITAGQNGATLSDQSADLTSCTTTTYDMIWFSIWMEWEADEAAPPWIGRWAGWHNQPWSTILGDRKRGIFCLASFSPLAAETPPKEIGLGGTMSRWLLFRQEQPHAPARSQTRTITKWMLLYTRRIHVGSEAINTLFLSGMCSPLSMDQTRSNWPSGKGWFKASATSNESWALSPWASASCWALCAWTGLRVMPLHLAPNFLARYRELPPMPHPTSTILFGFWFDSSAKFFIPSYTVR